MTLLCDLVTALHCVLPIARHLLKILPLSSVAILSSFVCILCALMIISQAPKDKVIMPWCSHHLASFLSLIHPPLLFLSIPGECEQVLGRCCVVAPCSSLPLTLPGHLLFAHELEKTHKLLTVIFLKRFLLCSYSVVNISFFFSINSLKTVPCLACNLIFKIQSCFPFFT